MPPPFKSTDVEIRYDSYVHIVCTQCNESMEVEYLGLDPTVPQIKVSCPNCKLKHTWKIYKATHFPPEAHKR